jgi:DNA-binding transcriptional regulator GbsR (MarR family)
MGDHRAIDAAEQAAAVMTAAGMARMPARVLMALVAAPDGGYTAAELGERLGVSAAAVSGAVRYLQGLHFIQRRSRPGDRRDHYELVYETFYASVASNGSVYERMSEQIDRIADEHADDARARDRALEMATFFRFMGERMPRLIDEWDEYRAQGAGDVSA